MTKVLSAKTTPEGRVVVPAAVRKALDLPPGGQVAFLMDGDQVRMVTARQMAVAVWAGNTAGPESDPVEDVRAMREADAQAEADAHDRIAADVAKVDGADERSEDELAADLLAFLDL